MACEIQVFVAWTYCCPLRLVYRCSVSRQQSCLDNSVNSDNQKTRTILHSDTHFVLGLLKKQIVLFKIARVKFKSLTVTQSCGYFCTWYTLILYVMIVCFFFTSQTCSGFVDNEAAAVISIADLNALKYMKLGAISFHIILKSIVFSQKKEGVCGKRGCVYGCQFDNHLRTVCISERRTDD